MPSFLSKVFGRKKDGKGSPPSRGRASDGSLLDGKFEVVSPVNSPSAAEFPENALTANGKEKNAVSGLFKVKSRPSRPSSPEPSKRENLPQLSLVLPVPKDDAQARALGVVFEADPDAQILTNDAIGSKTLTPLEALILVRTCSQAIIARGLETLGLMHPHWHSASPDVQRRLISLFIHSLSPNNAITTLSPNSSSSTSIFESEINYTRSAHDVVAVLRWGIRHLELGGGKFGRDESWYKTFSEAERSSEYLPKSYSEKLAPLIPPAHLELLNTTLDLFSSLAAHAERNSTSASRLTRAFGLWLLTAQRVGENDDWPKFYARWQDNGRILEHLFLARIRDESLRLRMPTRLTELVAQYPYVRGVKPADDVFLPPRVSTRHFDALFVRVETEFSSPREKVHRHPLQLLKDALTADVVVGESEFSALWKKIRNAGNDENEVSPGGRPGLSQAFADETIRYLTLVPGDHPLKRVTSSTFSITEISQEAPRSRRYASSPGPPETSSGDQAPNGTTTTNGHFKPASDPLPLPSALNSPLSTDWVQFSSAGFSDASAPLPLASTLLGQDVEKTNPPFRKANRQSKVPSLSRNTSATRRKSVDVTTPRRMSNSSQPEPIIKLPSKSFPVSVVEIDEAFIEFWVDALLDPISSTWPKFVICKLRSSLSDLTVNDKHIQYLVVEQVFVSKPAPPAPPAPPVEVVQSQPVEIARVPSRDKSTTASSPGRSSTKSEKRRFFGFFSSSGRHSMYSSPTTPSTKGKKRASPQAHNVSELGEVLEDSGDGKRKSSSSTVKLRIPSPKPRKSVDARKSVEVPKQVAEKDKVTAGEGKEKEREKEEEKESPSGDVAAAAADAAVTVAGAAAVALASAAAEEKDDVAATTSSPVAGVVAAEGSQFIEDLHKPVEEAVKVTGEAKPEDAAHKGEPTAGAVAVEVVQAEEQPAAVSEEAASQTAVSNGHTLSAITEKVEDADAAAPATPPSVEPAVETVACDEPLVAASTPEPEVSAVVLAAEEVSSVIVEPAMQSTPAPKSSPAAVAEEAEVKAEAESVTELVDVPPLAEEALTAGAATVAEEPVKEVGAVLEEVPTPVVEAAAVAEDLEENAEAPVEEPSVPEPASAKMPATAGDPVSAEVVTPETSPAANEEPAATYEEAIEVAQDAPNVADSMPVVPASEVLVSEVVEEAVLAAAVKPPPIAEPAAVEDHVVDGNSPTERVAIVEEATALAVEEPVISVAEEPTEVPIVTEKPAKLDEVTPVAEASPVGEDPIAAASVEPAVAVEAAPEPEPTEPTPAVEAVPDVEESMPAEPEPIKAEGAPAVTEAPVSFHDAKEPVEGAALVSESLTDSTDQAEQGPEAETAATNGNGYHATSPKKVIGDDVISTELHVDTKRDTEPTLTPVPVSDLVVPSGDAPEKLSEVIVEDD